jgi:hypothetical protein
MTTRTSTSALLQIFVAAYAVVGMTTSASLAQADPASPPAASAAAAQPPKPDKKSTPKATRAAPGKAKSASRAAKPAKTSAAPATTAESKDESAASAKPSQVMDFDTDDVAGTRLEPGFELIEGAPSKARHKSLVEPLKPGDSVVNRQ